jgi:hypothetical protein
VHPPIATSSAVAATGRAKKRAEKRLAEIRKRVVTIVLHSGLPPKIPVRSARWYSDAMLFATHGEEAS